LGLLLDSKRLSYLDVAVVGGAAVAFVAGFLPWVSYQVDLLPGPVSVHGWSAGFTAWAGVLLLSVAGLLWVVLRVGSWSSATARSALAVLGVSVVGLVLVFVRWLSLTSNNLVVYHWARYGIAVAVVAGIVEVSAALVATGASGEWLLGFRPGHRRSLG
jgi:hypothetical protein